MEGGNDPRELGHTPPLRLKKAELGPPPCDRAGLGPTARWSLSLEPSSCAFLSKYKTVSCVRLFDFSGRQAWFSSVNVPQVSLSRVTWRGTRHTPVRCGLPSTLCDPSCLVSKTPSHPALKAKLFPKEFMTNTIIPLNSGAVSLPAQ